MKAMILAAGYGTRLRPLTETLPKPLVPLCNRPLLGWAIESLLANDIRDLIVNVHHLPDLIEQYLRALRVIPTLSYEEVILGTGGALRRVRALLENEREFFLVNGDTVQFPPYHALVGHDSMATLTLRHAPEGDRFTPVFFENGLVTGFGCGRGEARMFSGVHCISSRIFHDFPDKEVFGIVDDVYRPLLDSGRETIAGVVDDGLWFDIGTPRRYQSASRSLLAAMVRGEIPPPNGSRLQGDSLVDETTRIDGPLVRSVAGARSAIRGELHDSAVWNDCAIGSGVRLERCIVAHGVEIDGPAEIHDAVITRDALLDFPPS